MASRGRRGGGQSSSRSGRNRGIPVTRHFSRVLNPEILQLKKLCIPNRFAAKYGSYLSSPVLLKVSDGKIWKVGIKKCGGAIWLSRWKKFIKNYCLREGYTMFFRYEGYSWFHVVILDGAGMEIKYPSRSIHRKKARAATQTFSQEMEESVIDIGNSTEEGSGDESDDPSQSSTSKVKAVESRRKKKYRMKSRSSPGPADGEGAPRWGRSRNLSRALEAANQFKTKNPSFQVQLRESYMTSGGVSICSDFMLKNGVKREPESFDMVTLKHPGSDQRRSWAVKMFTYEPEKRGKLCGGWAKFVADNSLRVGDVIIFELVDTSVFHVHIFRSSSRATPIEIE
ncbi:B3 domain-containing transcription factor VRN1-like [Punica granatum]|uniref:B3 domain-containing transcription factor VRN1-like n=1 Tax=Punica granatum TaxID=22663 RepID=A0A6P8EIA5_PUNGR|nr:B3 domain-containing transcription factor VRN1-like [Punica granatum]